MSKGNCSRGRRLLGIQWRRGLALLLFTTAGLVACSTATPSLQATPQYHVSSTRPSAQVVAANDTDQAIFDVYSDNGIGSAQVRLVLGEWPRTITLRFHLQGLEGLQFAYEEAVVKVSINTEALILQAVSANDGPETAIFEDSRYWMPVVFFDRSGVEVERPVAGGVIEVQAPAAFLAGDFREFTINWIDFYR